MMSIEARLSSVDIQELDRQHAIWRSAEKIKRLSDRVIGIGPFGVGLDGLLTWIPAVGGIYSLGSAAWLMTLALRSRASGGTITRMAAYLAVDVAITEFPLVGYAADFVLPAHLMAANALQKDIERRFGLPPEIPVVQRRRRWWHRIGAKG